MAQRAVFVSANENLRKRSSCLQKLHQLETELLRQRLYKRGLGARAIGCSYLICVRGWKVVNSDSRCTCQTQDAELSAPAKTEGTIEQAVVASSEGTSVVYGRTRGLSVGRLPGNFSIWLLANPL